MRVEEVTGLKFEDDGKPDAKLRFLYDVTVRAAQIEQAQSPEAQEARKGAEATQESQEEEPRYINRGGELAKPRVVLGNKKGCDDLFIRAQYDGWIQ